VRGKLTLAATLFPATMVGVMSAAVGLGLLVVGSAS
jgi:hypothetical protein